MFCLWPLGSLYIYRFDCISWTEKNLSPSLYRYKSDSVGSYKQTILIRALKISSTIHHPVTITHWNKKKNIVSYRLLWESIWFSMLPIKLLSLILLEPKVISLCHQYRAMPVCTSMQHDQALYILLADQLEVLILVSLKVIMDSAKNRWWINDFKKFRRLRVKMKHFSFIVDLVSKRI